MKTKKRHLSTGIALLFTLFLSAQEVFEGSIPLSALNGPSEAAYSPPETPASDRAPVRVNPFAYDPAKTMPAPVAAPEAARFTQFQGRILDEQTRSPLEDCILELFFIDENGEVQRTYSGRLRNAAFSLPMFRGFEHIALLRRQGYEAKAFYLGTMMEDRQHDFLLLASQFTHSPIKGTPISSGQTQMPPSPAEEEVMAPKPPIGYFQVIQATSLRATASHRSEILFRFQAGNEVEVLEKTEKFWWKVRYLGKTGYIKSFLLKNVKA